MSDVRRAELAVDQRSSWAAEAARAAGVPVAARTTHRVLAVRRLDVAMPASPDVVETTDVTPFRDTLLAGYEAMTIHGDVVVLGGASTLPAHRGRRAVPPARPPPARRAGIGPHTRHGHRPAGLDERRLRAPDMSDVDDRRLSERGHFPARAGGRRDRGCTLEGQPIDRKQISPWREPPGGSIALPMLSIHPALPGTTRRTSAVRDPRPAVPGCTRHRRRRLSPRDSRKPE